MAQALQLARTWCPPACAGQGQKGHGRGSGGPGCKELAPGYPCLAAAGFACWYSPPFSGAVPGSALRMRSPRRRKTPGLMVLPGMSRVSGAEPGPGLKSLAGVPRQLKPGLPAVACWPCHRQEGQEEGQFPEPAGAPPAIPLISGRAVLLGQGDPRGWGGQLGSGSCCPLQRTAPSLPQPIATPCPGFPPAPLAPRLPGAGAVDRPHGLVPVLQREQPKGLCHHGASPQPWLGSARRSLRAWGCSGSGTTSWERCPGPAQRPSTVMGLGWDRGASRSCRGPLAHGCCSLPPSLSQCFIYPTRDCFSNQVFTLWDANEPFLGARNPRELVSALQSLTAEGTSERPLDLVGRSPRGWRAPAWKREPLPAPGQRLPAGAGCLPAPPCLCAAQGCPRFPGTCSRAQGWRSRAESGHVPVYSVSVL